jgi:hypothetical protein
MRRRTWAPMCSRGGRDTKDNADFWRQMAQESPGSIKFASSHPTSAEWFLRLERTHTEIEAKRAANEPLAPTMKDGKPTQELPLADLDRTRCPMKRERRRSESNRRIADLQSAALPLGHGAVPQANRAQPPRSTRAPLAASPARVLN